MRRRRRFEHNINIVPYVDVMLVLLVIFMITAPLVRTSSVDLPTMSEANQSTDKPIEVTIQKDRSLILRDRSGSNIDIPVNLQTLISHLKDMKKSKPSQLILIAGDKNVRYEAVLEVMDELQQNNLAPVGLMIQASVTHNVVQKSQ